MLQFPDLFTHKFVTTKATGKYRHFSELIAERDFEVTKEISLQSEFELGNHSRSAESLLNNEISKYACASLETFLNIKSDNISVKSISWALIRAYYASFYAAHACLKAVGQFVTRLDNRSSEIIQREACLYYPASLKPFASEFHVKYDIGSNNLAFYQLTRGGGYHEKFWYIFNEFIDIGLNSPLNAQTVYQQELLFIQSLKDNVNRTGSPIWLSTMRNIINYQMPDDIWFPYNGKNKSQFYKNLILNANTEKQLVSDYKDLNSTNELAKFSCTCNGIIDLMIKITESYFMKSAISANPKKAVFDRLLKMYRAEKYIT